MFALMMSLTLAAKNVKQKFSAHNNLFVKLPVAALLMTKAQPLRWFVTSLDERS